MGDGDWMIRDEIRVPPKGMGMGTGTPRYRTVVL